MLIDLTGVWRLVSFQFEIVGEDQRVDVLGPTPTGRIIIANGFFTACLVAAGRKEPTNDAEMASLIRSMVAYTGKVRVEGDVFITEVDASWNEIFTGTEQARRFKIDGDTLRVSGVAPSRNH